MGCGQSQVVMWAQGGGNLARRTSILAAPARCGQILFRFGQMGGGTWADSVTTGREEGGFRRCRQHWAISHECMTGERVANSLATKTTRVGILTENKTFHHSPAALHIKYAHVLRCNRVIRGQSQGVSQTRDKFSRRGGTPPSGVSP